MKINSLNPTEMMSACGKCLMIMGIVVALSACSTKERRDFAPDFELAYNQDLISQDNFWPDQKLKDRFTEYWALRLSKDAKNAFLVEAPHFQELVGFDQYAQYVQGFRGEIEEIKLKNLEYRSMQYVALSISFNRKSDGRVENEISNLDRWILVDDVWYHIVKDSLMFQQID